MKGKAHFKKFENGFTLRVSDISKNKRDQLIRLLKEDLATEGCEIPTVKTFSDPLPSCGPDEARC